jgi:hypothetical protein
LDRGYDAQNRLIAGGYTSLTRVYSWGPNNHPDRIVDSNGHQETLHWNGNGLLFTTNAAGQVDDLKIEDFGDVNPLDTTFSGLILADRDPSGTETTRHTLDGSTDYWNIINPILGPSYSLTTSTNPTGIFTQIDGEFPYPQIPIGEPREDGINDGYNTIQGVRAFDSSLHGWTTPDAYSGDISDPMSRKSYMWNRNNPVSYADPSGYISQDSVPVETSAFMAANKESIANSIEQEFGPDEAQEYVNKILQNPNISDFVKDTMRAVGTRLSGWKAEIQKDGGYMLRNPDRKADFVPFKPPSARPNWILKKIGARG